MVLYPFIFRFLSHSCNLQLQAKNKIETQSQIGEFIFLRLENDPAECSPILVEFESFDGPEIV